MYRLCQTAGVRPLANPAAAQTRIQALIIRMLRSSKLTHNMRVTVDPKSQLFFWRKNMEFESLSGNPYYYDNEIGIAFPSHPLMKKLISATPRQMEEIAATEKNKEDVLFYSRFLEKHHRVFFGISVIIKFQRH